MTKETYEALKPYAEKLNTATVTGWARVSRQELEAINKVAKDAVGRELNKGQMSCPNCVIRLLKDIDKAYKAYVPPKPKRTKKTKEE